MPNAFGLPKNSITVIRGSSKTLNVTALNDTFDLMTSGSTFGIRESWDWDSDSDSLWDKDRSSAPGIRSNRLNLDGATIYFTVRAKALEGSPILIQKMTPASLTTTIAAGSNAVNLPNAVINVVSTAGFSSIGILYVVTSAGTQTVTYTGITSTSFTGCAEGTGTMYTGNRVINAAPYAPPPPAEIFISDSRRGVFAIYLLPSDTYGLATGDYTFDVWAILPTGEQFPLILPSMFQVQGGVTQLP